MSSPDLQINVEIEALNRALILYRDLTNKTPEDVLLKQGGKLGYAVAKHLRGLAPAKGEIRSERLAALKAGQGVHVRQRVRLRVMQKYGARIDVKSRGLIFGNSKNGKKSMVRKGGKRLNLWALTVQAELNTRESGRGFLARSSSFPKTLQDYQTAQSIYGPILSDAGLNSDKDTLTFKWDPARSELASSAAKGLSRAQGEEAIAAGIADTRDDIKEYISRKLLENARKAGLN
jgi:hypothetical protein